MATPPRRSAPASRPAAKKAQRPASKRTAPAQKRRSRPAVKIARPPAPAKVAAAKASQTATPSGSTGTPAGAMAIKVPLADKPIKAKKAHKIDKGDKVAKAPKKDKLVRDSFTMPESDFKLIAEIKRRALGMEKVVKKSEVLRAGLTALQTLPEAQLKALLDNLPVIKTGRPKKAD